LCEYLFRPPAAGVRRYINQKLALAGKFGHELTIIAPGAETRMEPAHGGTIAWIKSPHLPFDRNYRMFWNHSSLAHPGPAGAGSGGGLLALARWLAGGALVGQGGQGLFHACRSGGGLSADFSGRAARTGAGRRAVQLFWRYLTG